MDKFKENEDNVVWICSFCEHKNVIGAEELKFARNNMRVVEKAGGPNGQRKDPILLIVFDISGSMEEVVGDEHNNYSSLVDRIKKTKIYQKIVSK
jgi:hypothetical protein